jgi:hypothetical protein
MHLKHDSTAIVFDVTEEDFDAAVVARSQQTPVLVDIGADWCSPCLVLGPLLDPALADVGYETPSPIQAACIPHPARRPRPPRRGPDRHRQDRRLRAARPRDRSFDLAKRQPAGSDPGAHARTRHPGRRSLPEVRQAHARLPRAADLRRPEHGRPAAPAVARRPRHRRHPRPRHGPPRAQEPQPRQPHDPGARRSRRNAAHGLHRRRRMDPRAHAGGTPDRAVLGHHAGRHPPRRPPLPARPEGNQDQVGHGHRGRPSASAYCRSPARTSSTP